MTDQELIKAFRECDRYPICSGCPKEQGECPVGEFTAEKLVDRLEALLAEVAEMDQQIQKGICKRVDVDQENEHLREAMKMMPQWVSVDEKLPELVKLDDPEGDDWRESKRVFVVTADGECTVATFWKINETFGWTDDINQTSVTVKAWMTPEPPSTEGVE